ncbi:peptidase inhibitor family I36 protein [Streptomyces tsukubensis]
MTPVATFVRRAGVALGTLALIALPTADAAAAATNPPGVYILNEQGENGPSCPVGWFCFYHAAQHKWFSFAVLPGTDVPDVGALKFSGGGSIASADSNTNNTLLRYCGYPQPNYGGAEVPIAPFSGGTWNGLKSFRVC